MKIVYSEKQKLHAIKTEMSNGNVQPCFEKPQRADMILNRIKETNLGEISTPTDFGMTPLEKIHEERYLNLVYRNFHFYKAINKQ